MGNWDVLGLRATGSFDYTLSEGDELFVPTHMTYGFDVGAPRRGGVQGALGLAGYSAWAHSAWAVGVGRRMLDELVKVIVAAPGSVRQVARQRELQVSVRAGRGAFPRRAVRWSTKPGRASRRLAPAANSPSLEQMTMIKLSLRHIHDVSPTSRPSRIAPRAAPRCTTRRCSASIATSIRARSTS